MFPGKRENVLDRSPSPDLCVLLLGFVPDLSLFCGYGCFGSAAVAWEAGKPLVIEEVEVAPPQAMEVRIKILFTALCHTDVYFSFLDFLKALQAAEGARVARASRIIGVDLNPNRFEEAKKFGCTEFLNPKDYDKPIQDVIAERTNGGVDRSVECTGNINAMISAFECVHDGWGVSVLVGVPHQDAAFKTHPIKFLNEKTLKGTFYGNDKTHTHIARGG
ncbi:alcohol dehydrogenase 1-like [Nymphaea colorata]|nr:alcohol dehydrogenase 1-like [Nymphaea colorata]